MSFERPPDDAVTPDASDDEELVEDELDVAMTALRNELVDPLLEEASADLDRTGSRYRDVVPTPSWLSERPSLVDIDFSAAGGAVGGDAVGRATADLRATLSVADGIVSVAVELTEAFAAGGPELWLAVDDGEVVLAEPLRPTDDGGLSGALPWPPYAPNGTARIVAAPDPPR